MLRRTLAALLSTSLACGGAASDDADQQMESPGGVPSLGGSSKTPGVDDGAPDLPGGAPAPVVDPRPPEPGDRDLSFAPSPSPAPTLQPRLVTLALVGGAGDQWLEDVYFEPDGRIVASSPAFTVTLSADGRRGVVAGDLDATMEGDVARPSLPGAPGRSYAHPATGLDLAVGYRQAGRSLQTPIVRAFRGEDLAWRLWGHAGEDIEAANLGADSRCYQAWGMPGGRIGVQCWTDGGNSVLARDPRDLSEGAGWNEGSWMRGAGGMSTLYALVDPAGEGAVLSGTFVAAHVAHVAVDPWGRVYLAQAVRNRQNGEQGSDVFGVGATSGSLGLAVLSPDLRDVVFNANLAAECEGGQRFSDVALRDGLLVLVGATCGGALEQKNPLQADAGGGRDGIVVVVKLW